MTSDVTLLQLPGHKHGQALHVLLLWRGTCKAISLTFPSFSFLHLPLQGEDSGYDIRKSGHKEWFLLHIMTGK